MITYQRKRKCSSSSSMRGGSCQKKGKASDCESRDMISELPDEILHHILSHLTTKSAIQTSVVSKRWSRTWAFSSVLHFDQREFASATHFISFVEAALKLHSGSNVDRFVLYWHDGFDMLKAERWIKYAKQHRLRELWLDIPGGKGRPLPAFFFHGGTQVRFYSSSSSSSSSSSV